MVTRRDFLKRMGAMAAAGVVAPSILDQSSAFARKVAASDRINIGLIGLRNMGWGDLNDMLAFRETQCVALCDVNSSLLKSRAAEIVKRSSRKPDLYGDYRKMLERKDIDVVVIGSPDHWHCLQMIDSCSAGKDVYVEKPIANTIAECDLMAAASHHYNQVIQVGQQQRSGEHWHEMKRYIDSGKLGRIAKVNVWANFSYCNVPYAATEPTPKDIDFDMWLGPAPKREYNTRYYHGLWRMFWDYGGGLLTDWGVHLLDMALWGMNVKSMPRRVVASGGNFCNPKNMAETFDTMSVVWEYDDFTINWSNQAFESGPYGRCYGVEFVGENGSLVVNRENWQVYPLHNKIPVEVREPDYTDRHRHMRNFLDCVRSRNKQTACTVDNGALCAKFAHLGNISARTGEALRYDEKRKAFDNREANKLLSREYRNGWKMPKF